MVRKISQKYREVRMWLKRMEIVPVKKKAKSNILEVVGKRSIWRTFALEKEVLQLKWRLYKALLQLVCSNSILQE